MREAAAAVPRMFWGRSNTTVHIPETEDWAGKDLSITGLARVVGKAYARHIAAASPANVLHLLEERDELLALVQDLLKVFVHDPFDSQPLVDSVVARAEESVARAQLGVYA
ncbi:hypothetical protein CUR95_24130 [Bordetella bronchiseptica]|nr:hypothetical protein [Bordetella bronchiseptica]